MFLVTTYGTKTRQMPKLYLQISSHSAYAYYRTINNEHSQAVNNFTDIQQSLVVNHSSDL